MKKTIWLTLILSLLLVAFAACENNETNPTGTIAPATQEATTPSIETEDSETVLDETTAPDTETSESAHTHTWSDWITITKPTCEEGGQAQRYCTVCYLNQTKPLEATGHDEVIDATVAPTCTETGLTEGKHCSVCSAVLVAQTTVEALGHTPGPEATCTTSHDCTVCGVQLDMALGHSYVASVTPPTVTSNGLTEYVCSRCTHAYTVDIVPKDFTVTSNNRAWIGYTGAASEDLNIPTAFQHGGVWYRVTSIDTAAFWGCTNLESVTIPDGVTSIGNAAFEGCTGLTSVTIPDSVTSIGSLAFSCCSVTSIIIPAGVKNIDDYTFSNCSSLTSITIPDSVMSIGQSAFSGCTSLTSISIPDKVTRIENYTFYCCTGLNSIELSNSVTSIGVSAFFGCIGLTSVIIPNSVTSIGSHAFYECTGLTAIEIPNSVTSIGFSALSGCSSLESIVLPFVGDSVKTASDTPQYPFGYIFGTTKYDGGTETIQQYYGDEISLEVWKSATYYIPTSLKSVTITGGNILSGAFSGCTGLTSVTLPNGITNIGPYAFSGCADLTSIVIPNSVNCIDGHAFYRCSGLTSVVIPDNVTNIGNGAFAHCSGLNSITISNSVTSIGEYAFSGCTGLTSIVIPDGITNIGHYTFYGCTSLVSLEIPDGVTGIGEWAFAVCTRLTSIVIPDSVTSIGFSAFSGCSSLECITLPFVGASSKTASDTHQYPLGYIFGQISYVGSVKTQQYYIEEQATHATFYIPASLKSVTITGGNILYGAFYNCNGLTSIVIPDNVMRIGDFAFYNCSGLNSVVIPNSVTSIGRSAFFGCTSLTSITLPFVGAEKDGTSSTQLGYLFGLDNDTYNSSVPASLKTVVITGDSHIDDYAFSGCKDLTSMVIGDDVTSIGYGAFEACYSLASVVIGDGVTSIGDSSFSKCSSLTSIVIPNSVTSIGKSAFRDCSSLASVVLGDSVTSIGDYMFWECSGLTSIAFTGTMAQWNTISRGSYWKYHVPATELICSDGVVALRYYS